MHRYICTRLFTVNILRTRQYYQRSQKSNMSAKKKESVKLDAYFLKIAPLFSS